MKEIKLNHGYSAMVDDDDYDFLSKFNWHTVFQHKSRAVREAKTNVWDRVLKKSNGVSMHIMILGHGGVIDHKDGNPLNNQKANLRRCTQAENVKNRAIQRGNKSGFKGVFFQKKLGRWRAQISVMGKAKHLGCFDDPAVAALSYNEAAKKYYGEFARLNSIPCAV